MMDRLAEIEAHLEDDRKAAIRDRMGMMPLDVSHRTWLIAALKVDRAERKRLAELIDDTAKHWLDLQAKYPIRWEGAIDNAMQAACSEILQLLDLVAGSGRKILECAQLQLRAEDAEAALRESREREARLQEEIKEAQVLLTNVRGWLSRGASEYSMKHIDSYWLAWRSKATRAALKDTQP